MSKLEEQIEKEEGKKVEKLEGYKRVESTWLSVVEWRRRFFLE